MGLVIATGFFFQGRANGESRTEGPWGGVLGVCFDDAAREEAR